MKTAVIENYELTLPQNATSEEMNKHLSQITQSLALRHLILNFVSNNNACWRLVADAVRNSQITVLDASGVKLSCTNLRTLLNCIGEPLKLNELMLKNNAIAGLGAKRLLEAIEKTPQLYHVSIGGNNKIPVNTLQAINKASAKNANRIAQMFALLGAQKELPLEILIKIIQHFGFDPKKLASLIAVSAGFFHIAQEKMLLSEKNVVTHHPFII